MFCKNSALIAALALLIVPSQSQANGFFDGVMQVLGAEFAKYAIEAIKNQNSNSSAPAPIPSSSAYTTPQPTQVTSHYKTYWNSRFGFKIPYPENLLEAKGESENSDGQMFVSNNGKSVLVAYGRFATSNLFSEENEQLEPIRKLTSCFKYKVGV